MKLLRPLAFFLFTYVVLSISSIFLGSLISVPLFLLFYASIPAYVTIRLSKTTPDDRILGYNLLLAAVCGLFNSVLMLPYVTANRYDLLTSAILVLAITGAFLTAYLVATVVIRKLCKILKFPEAGIKKYLSFRNLAALELLLLVFIVYGQGFFSLVMTNGVPFEVYKDYLQFKDRYGLWGSYSFERCALNETPVYVLAGTDMANLDYRFFDESGSEYCAFTSMFDNCRGGGCMRECPSVSNCTPIVK